MGDVDLRTVQGKRVAGTDTMLELPASWLVEKQSKAAAARKDAPAKAKAASDGPNPKRDSRWKSWVGCDVEVEGKGPGRLAYFGPVNFVKGDSRWCGIALNDPNGRNDGSVDGRRYFKCPPDHGVFVNPIKVTVLTEGFLPWNYDIHHARNARLKQRAVSEGSSNGSGVAGGSRASGTSSPSSGGASRLSKRSATTAVSTPSRTSATRTASSSSSSAGAAGSNRTPARRTTSSTRNAGQTPRTTTSSRAPLRGTAGSGTSLSARSASAGTTTTAPSSRTPLRRTSSSGSVGSAGSRPPSRTSSTAGSARPTLRHSASTSSVEQGTPGGRAPLRRSSSNASLTSSGSRTPSRSTTPTRRSSSSTGTSTTSTKRSPSSRTSPPKASSASASGSRKSSRGSAGSIVSEPPPIPEDSLPSSPEKEHEDVDEVQQLQDQQEQPKPVSSPGRPISQSLQIKALKVTQRLEAILPKLESLYGVRLPSLGNQMPAPTDDEVMQRWLEVVLRLEKAAHTVEVKVPRASGRTLGRPNSMIRDADDEPLASVVLRGLDEMVGPALQEYFRLSCEVGGPVEGQARLVHEAMDKHRAVILKAASMTCPDQATLQKMLMPLSQAIAEIQTYREERDNPNDPYFDHLTAVSDGCPALGWMSTGVAPQAFVRDMRSSAEFYCNKVIKRYKESSPVQAAWSRSYLQLLDHLGKYLAAHHKYGLQWHKDETGRSNSFSGSIDVTSPVLSRRQTPSQLSSRQSSMDTMDSMSVAGEMSQAAAAEPAQQTPSKQPQHAAPAPTPAPAATPVAASTAAATRRAAAVSTQPQARQQPQEQPPQTPAPSTGVKKIVFKSKMRRTSTADTPAHPAAAASSRTSSGLKNVQSAPAVAATEERQRREREEQQRREREAAEAEAEQQRVEQERQRREAALAAQRAREQAEAQAQAKARAEAEEEQRRQAEFEAQRQAVIAHHQTNGHVAVAVVEPQTPPHSGGSFDYGDSEQQNENGYADDGEYGDEQDQGSLSDPFEIKRQAMLEKLRARERGSAPKSRISQRRASMHELQRQASVAELLPPTPPDQPPKTPPVTRYRRGSIDPSKSSQLSQSASRRSQAPGQVSPMSLAARGQAGGFDQHEDEAEQAEFEVRIGSPTGVNNPKGLPQWILEEDGVDFEDSATVGARQREIELELAREREIEHQFMMAQQHDDQQWQEHDAQAQQWQEQAAAAAAEWERQQSERYEDDGEAEAEDPQHQRVVKTHEWRASPPPQPRVSVAERAAELLQAELENSAQPPEPRRATASSAATSPLSTSFPRRASYVLSASRSSSSSSLSKPRMAEVAVDVMAASAGLGQDDTGYGYEPEAASASAGRLSYADMDFDSVEGFEDSAADEAEYEQRRQTLLRQIEWLQQREYQWLQDVREMLAQA